MNRANATTILLLVSAAVLPYLLSQNDVVIPPIAKVLLTAANIAVVTLARLSNPNSEPIQVAAATPIPVAIASAEKASSTNGTPLPTDDEPQG